MVVARAEVGVAGHVLQVLILQLCSVCQQVVGCRESSMDVVVRHLRAMYPEQCNLASMNSVDNQMRFDEAPRKTKNC